MDIRVQTSGAPCSPAMAAHVRRRLHDRLLHRNDSVESVDVRLGDPRGRLGMHDMYCLMQVHLFGAPAATVVDMGEDMYAVIDRAAERAGRLAGAQLAAAKAQPVGASAR
jgi:putative sigma-54 modulation protein